MNKKIKKAVSLSRNFNGVEPGYIDTVEIPEYDVAIKIGVCTHIAYLAEDGKNYIHKFKPKSAPMLATTYDGKHLLLLHGKFRFTDRGIVDS